MKNLRAIIHNIIGLALAIFGTAIFWIFFIRKSDFSWTAEQSGTINAVVEIALVIFFTAYILYGKFSTKSKIALVIIEVLGFAFLHSFIWAMIVGIVYSVVTIHWGSIVCRLIKVEDEIHSSFLVGFVCIISIVAILSCFKVGTPNYLRICIPLLEIIVLIIDRKASIKRIEQIKKIFNYIPSKLDTVNVWASTFMIAAICILIGKANYCTDYDSLWYGLRSEYVLAPFTGIYDNINLVAAVYTYPKAFEIFTLVFAGLNSFSFIIGVNFAVWLLMGLVLLDIIKELGVCKNKEIIIPMLLMLTPSITNLVNSAKPDVLSLYILLIGILYSLKGIKFRNSTHWALAFSSIIMTFAIKSTSILFSTILIMVFLIYRIMAGSKKGDNRIASAIWIVPLVGGFVVYARTYILTGLPMTSLVVSVLSKLGFKIKYPYVLNSSRVTSIGDLLSQDGLLLQRIIRLVQIFFYPNTSALVTTERTWWGMLFSILWLIAVADFLIHIKKRITDLKNNMTYGIVNAMFVLTSITSIGTMLILDMPDGNYYISLHAITYIYLGIYIVSQMVNDYSFFIPIIVDNIVLSIVISCAWSVGFTPINIKDLGYYNHDEKYKQVVMASCGLCDLYDYMKERDKSRSLIIANKKEDELLSLPGITELYMHQLTWASYSLENPEELQDFLSYTGTDYLIVDYDMSEESIYSKIIDLEKMGYIKHECDKSDFAVFKTVQN